MCYWQTQNRFLVVLPRWELILGLIVLNECSLSCTQNPKLAFFIFFSFLVLKLYRVMGFILSISSILWSSSPAFPLPLPYLPIKPEWRKIRESCKAMQLFLRPKHGTFLSLPYKPHLCPSLSRGASQLYASASRNVEPNPSPVGNHFKILNKPHLQRLS